MWSVSSENFNDCPWCHEVLVAHTAVHRHLQPVWFRAGELNQKQWVQDALWDRLRGLHDHQGRTWLVHTVHWHTSAPHTSMSGPQHCHCITRLSIQHHQKNSTCLRCFTPIRLSHTVRPVGSGHPALNKFLLHNVVYFLCIYLIQSHFM